MRKFFALALAVAMVLSLASVSFAAAGDVALTGPFRYDADENDMLPGDGAMGAMRYGSAAYYLIEIDDGAGFDTQQVYKDVEKLKVKAEFEAGKDLVTSISIVKKYVDDDEGVVATDGYYYFVELKLAGNQTTSESDVVVSLEFNRKANTKRSLAKIDDAKIDVSFPVFYKETWNKGGVNANKVTTGMELKWDTDYALKFDTDDEVELEFGYNDLNEGVFTVDASGQGKVFVRYNTKANEAIANANPGVKMHFINFNNVKFNRVGELVYEMEDMVAAYKVVGDQLVEIKGLEIDGEEAVFNTRVLESYVFADAELVNPVAAAAPVVEAPAAVTNPSTGA